MMEDSVVKVCILRTLSIVYMVMKLPIFCIAIRKVTLTTTPVWHTSCLYISQRAK
jgi:hypothetical protein